MTSSRVLSLAVSDTDVFAGTVGGGVFLSTDGMSWTQVNTGLTRTIVFAFAVSGMNLFAGCYNRGGIFRSSDNGTVWEQVNTGLTTSTSTEVYTLTVSGARIFAGTHDGVYLSTNDGTSWARVSTGLTSSSVYAFAVSNTNLFAGTYRGGVFRSTDNGTNWTQVNVGLSNLDVLSLTVSDTNLFAGTYGGGAFRSSNNGISWTQINTGLTNFYIRSLAVLGTCVFAGADYGGVFRSTDNGTHWIAVNIGLPYTYASIQSLVVSGANLIAGTGGKGVYLSSNSGASWTQVDSGLTNSDIRALAVSDTNLFAGTWASGAWRRPLSEMITDVAPQHPEIPKHFALEQNYPNPFNPTTVIHYSVTSRQYVILRVYNVLGQTVATLVDGVQEVGYKSVNFSGEHLPSGVYLYRFTAGTFSETKKLLLLK